jgi:PAS domain-containing protein
VRDEAEAYPRKVVESDALLRELVDHLRRHRSEHRGEWARRISAAELLTAMTPEEIFSEATSVYDNYVEVLETGSVEGLQDYARKLSERIIPRGVETHEVLGTVLLLRDVLARSLFQMYQHDYELLSRVLDAYEPAANRIANTVGVSFVEERERIIRQQQSKLEEQEARLRQLVEGVGAIVWEADAQTLELTFVSERAKTILIEPVESNRRPGLWGEHIHPDDRHRVLEAARVAVANGHDYALEYRAIAAKGGFLWLRDIVHVALDDSGAPKWLRGVMFDITPMKEAHRVLWKSSEHYAHLARTLQQSLLPLNLPYIPNVEVEVKYRPAAAGDEVGGDFYDVFATAADEWAVVIGDVQGKGVQAAALTGLARHTIRAATIYEGRPSRVLATLNQALMRHAGDETSPQFCTSVLGLLQTDQRSAHLVLANGGHEQPRVLRADGSIEKVSHPGTLLGVFADPEIFDDHVRLAPGDSVILFTDGVVDARRHKEEFGEDRLEGVLGACAGCNAAAIVKSLDEKVVAFASESLQDDMAFMVLQVPGSGY